ncbi:zinc finger protein 2-like isoform X2 [Microcaecilia unicolor]|uniref:Zinc finger protein 2-like isoform X2 n=1 Tax=Microcaecilia unicolor TaxID=1415580 RepID=A0A6P7XLQ9_9AMPH|nr:zinc finger protein 2-like isoform X2 [Microcaecilia unicolor]
MSTIVSDQASVAFSDVAAFFLEAEWDILEEQQKELYKKVIKEIHIFLISRGHSILNPAVIFKIKNDNEKQFTQYCEWEGKENMKNPTMSSPNGKPEILIRFKEQRFRIEPQGLEKRNLPNVSTREELQETDHGFKINKKIRLCERQQREEWKSKVSPPRVQETPQKGDKSNIHERNSSYCPKLVQTQGLEEESSIFCRSCCSGVFHRLL